MSAAASTLARRALRWALGLAAVAAAGCGGPEKRAAPTPSPSPLATSVGRTACAGCHDREAKLHEGSRHHLAGQEATEATVPGEVSCEVCHGPGSNHAARAEAAARDGRPKAEARGGFTFELVEPVRASWVIDRATGTARRSPPPVGPRAEVEMCARCHARSSTLSGAEFQGQPLLETHLPALLEEPLYHADGQIRDEVHVYGSFLQSRMYRASVSCSDCHDPHSSGVRAAPGDVCGDCHATERFASVEHHHHAAGTESASCVACHMSPRRDHSFRVPRPDLSSKLGTPNACSGCHHDRSVGWVAQAFDKWYGPAAERPAHYGETLQAGRRGLPGAGASLAALALNTSAPGIARATALALLGAYPSPATLGVLEAALGNGDPLIRIGALTGAESLPPGPRLRLAAPLLSDTVLAVRVEAARILLSAPRGSLTGPDAAAFQRALAEYRAALEHNADRPEGRLGMGFLYLAEGQTSKAEREYREAIDLDPAYAPAYVNLADLYRSQGRDAEGEKLLREAVQRAPGDAGVQHALGLLLLRRQRPSEAISPLGRAYELRPEEARFGLVFGVALDAAGKPALALDVLRRVHERHPGHRDVLLALVRTSIERGDRGAARDYARKLQALAPDDPETRRQIDELDRR
jgi:Flp pilus assembly protein TadD